MEFILPFFWTYDVITFFDRFKIWICYSNSWQSDTAVFAGMNIVLLCILQHNWQRYSNCFPKYGYYWIIVRILPAHDVWHFGSTVMVTRTGLDSFPPQSVAMTDRTWLRDSWADNGAVLVMTPCWSTWNGWSGLEMVYWQMSPKVGEQSLSVALTFRIDSTSSPSSTCPEYSSSLHSGMYSFTSFTVTWTSTLKH